MVTRIPKDPATTLITASISARAIKPRVVTCSNVVAVLLKWKSDIVLRVNL